MTGLQPLSLIVVAPEPRDIGAGLQRIGDYEPVKDGLRPIEEMPRLDQARVEVGLSRV